MNAKTLTALILFAAVGGAHAATTVEVGAGIAYGTPRHDGVWYQQRFAHQLDMKASALSIGVRSDLTDHVALHVGAYWNGTNRSDAWAVTDDALYVPGTPTGCPSTCPPLAHFMAHGWTGGVRALTEWHTTGAWQFGVMAGPIIYRETWTLDVPNWFAATPTAGGGYTAGPVDPVHTHDARWVVSGAAGVRLAHGSQAVELMFYRDGKSLRRGQYWPPIWRNHVTLSYVFTF